MKHINYRKKIHNKLFCKVEIAKLGFMAILRLPLAVKYANLTVWLNEKLSHQGTLSFSVSLTG